MQVLQLRRPPFVWKNRRMRCPACLAEAIGSGKYCAACGTRIQPAVDAPAPSARAAPTAPHPLALADTPAIANPKPPEDPNDLAFSATDAPPPVQETVDPFASTANPSDGALQAAAASAGLSAESGRVSPLASSSFDLGSDSSPVSRGPLPAAGNPPPRSNVEAAGPMSASAPRSKHGSTVLLSAMPSRAGVAKSAPVPAAAAAVVPAPVAPVAPALPPPMAHAAMHAGPPASGYASSSSPLPRALQPSSPAPCLTHEPSGVRPETTDSEGST